MAEPKSENRGDYAGRVIWAKNPIYGGFFPAVIIDKKFQLAINKSLKNKLSLICSLCSWPLGKEPFFHCKAHRNFLCEMCLRRLKHSIPRRNTTSLKNCQHDPKQRSLVTRKAWRKLVDMNISLHHLDCLEQLQISDLSNSLDLLYETRGKRKDIEVNLENDSDRKTEVYFLDGIGTFCSIVRKETFPFIENFSRLSNKNNQSMDGQTFTTLRNSVRSALFWLGNLEPRCQTKYTVWGDFEDCYGNLCHHCGEVGDLLCCDNCTRVFHSQCVNLQSVPSGSWRCDYCKTRPFLLNVAMSNEETAKIRFKRKDAEMEGKECNIENNEEKKMKRYGLRSRSENTKKEIDSSINDWNRIKKNSFLPIEGLTTKINVKKNNENESFRNHLNELFRKKKIMTNSTMVDINKIAETIDKSLKEILMKVETKLTQKDQKSTEIFDDLDRFAVDLKQPNSAINYFIEKEFDEFVYLIEIPTRNRMPSINEENGQGGYSVNFEALGFYRPEFSKQHKKWHVWAADKVPLKTAQRFLLELRSIVVDNLPVFQSEENTKEKRPKEEVKEETKVENGLSPSKFFNFGGKIVGIPPPPPIHRGEIVGKCPRFARKQNLGRAVPRKGTPRKRNRRESFIKGVEDLEKENTLTESILTCYTKEKHGNLMKLKAASLKEKDLEKRLNELKQKVNIKNVVNCETVKQILFYTQNIEQCKKRPPKTKDADFLLKVFKRELEGLSVDGKRFKGDISPGTPLIHQKNAEPNLGLDSIIEEHQICPKHRTKMRSDLRDVPQEEKAAVQKKVALVDRVLGWKIDRGEIQALVRYRKETEVPYDRWAKIDAKLGDEFEQREI